jgi:hypothetical protein
MRNSVLAATACAAWIVLGCDDSSGDGFTTTTLASTTTFTTTSTTFGNPGTTIRGSTTSIIVDVFPCVVTWRVTNAITLGALQFTTDYSNAGGSFLGEADTVDCMDLSGSLATFNDDEAQARLNAGFINLGGIMAPASVARCRFFASLSDHDPDASEFTVTVVDATDPSLNPVTADVAISDCLPEGASTTTTTLAVR